MKHGAWRGAAVVTVGLALLLAACGSGDDDDATSASTTSAGVTTTAAAGRRSDHGRYDGSAGGSGYCAGEADDAIDADFGAGAGYTAWVLACAAEKPLKAEGEPILVGLQNSQGDPAGTFPEFTGGMEAAVEFINEELGGVGADWATGQPGRPIQLETCFMAINPADAVRCANELAGKKPVFVLQGLNFFTQTVYPLFQAAGVGSLTAVPINAADYNAEGVYSIGAGGACVGEMPGMVEFAVNTLAKDVDAPRIGVPWSDTPPGVVCFNDLEKKPLNILAGTTEGPADAYNTRSGLEFLGVPILPASPSVAAQATQLLDFDPDVIFFAAQSSDCWSLVGGLSSLGWDAETTPLILSSACVDLQKIEQAGDAATGIYFVGANVTSSPELYEGITQQEAQLFVDKLEQYSPETQLAGFSSTAFNSTMTMWDVMSEVVRNGGEITSESVLAAVGATDQRHNWANTPLDCANAVEGYRSICNTAVTATRWNGEEFEVVQEAFDGTYIIAGTEIDTGS